MWIEAEKTLTATDYPLVGRATLYSSTAVFLPLKTAGSVKIHAVRVMHSWQMMQEAPSVQSDYSYSSVYPILAPSADPQ